ncbi:hypothetical protein [Staphylococcus borealis]|uniref:hypothetical protein n=1 Tax=Staphylococcus borealis TaxID=2742203 RepID=UPI0039E789A1
MQKIINILIIAILSVILIGLIVFGVSFGKDILTHDDSLASNKDENHSKIQNEANHNESNDNNLSNEVNQNNTSQSNNNSENQTSENLSQSTDSYNNDNDDTNKMRVNRSNVFDYLKNELGAESFKNLRYEEPVYNYEKNCWEILATNKSVGNQLMYYVHQDGGIDVQMQ